MFKNVKVGDQLWCVQSRTNSGLVPVTKVGRKWITFGKFAEQRADIETGQIDGGNYSSPGSLWPSEEAYTAHVKLRQLWRDFARRIPPYSPPNGVQEQDIWEVAAILGIKLEA